MGYNPFSKDFFNYMFMVYAPNFPFMGLSVFPLNHYVIYIYIYIFESLFFTLMVFFELFQKLKVPINGAPRFSSRSPYVPKTKGQ